ncbi:MAG TPA: site-2 protease family protein, partial [Polyangiaceae bacterium]|nr:site-2 protease family protein [Polyangiaceae bacterium]
MGHTSIASLLVWYVVFLFSTTFHEAAHSFLAYIGGDRTAYEGGQVSLDPLPHIRREPFGLVIVPILSFFLAGWMIGWASAPYDPEWARREPRKYSAMSFAGPAANLLLALIAFASMKLLVGSGVLEFARGGLDQLVVPSGDPEARGALGAVAMALSVLLSLNVLLGVFNLLPIPPLDGAAVLEGLFPHTLGDFFRTIRSTGAYQMLGMIVAWKVFGYLAYPLLAVVLVL